VAVERERADVREIADRLQHMPLPAARAELSEILDRPKILDGRHRAGELHFNALLVSALREREIAIWGLVES
jgi:hypothetical protein